MTGKASHSNGVSAARSHHDGMPNFSAHEEQLSIVQASVTNTGGGLCVDPPEEKAVASDGTVVSFSTDRCDPHFLGISRAAQALLIALSEKATRASFALEQDQPTDRRLR
jgi:hypothetical protein